MDPDALAKREKEKYSALWEHLPNYREISPGELFAGSFLKHFQITPGETLIDFGCGTGRVAKLFLEKGLRLKLVDLAPNSLDQEITLLNRLCPDQVEFWEACLWDLPKTLPPVDWIYCCDVLEHIPEAQVEAVLAGMAARTCKGGFLSISLGQDLIGEKVIGEPLHLTLKPHPWWESKIASHWNIDRCESIHDNQWLNFYLIKN